MLVNKLYLVIGIVFLSTFRIGNLGYKMINNPIIYTKTKEVSVLEKNIQDSGKEIYTDFCIQCHGANGKGDGKNFPPLDGSDWLTKKRAQSIHAVKFGQSGEIIVNKIKFNNTMPPMGLSNQEVADVMNYVMNSWSNKQRKKVTEKEVEKIIK
jgi:mono/diheme cytochrome c family protein